MGPPQINATNATNAIDAIDATNAIDAIDATNAIDAIDATNAIDAIDAMNAIDAIDAIGTGYWGQNLVRNFHELHALAAVCDSDQGRLRAMADRYAACPAFTDHKTLLKEDSIAAVAIAAPAERHAALVREALIAGKDVFVEKPLCWSVSEGEELVALAHRVQGLTMNGL